MNVYGADAVSSLASNTPKPLKSIGNLTTSITSMRFNPDSQLLALASNTKKDQMRMVQTITIHYALYMSDRSYPSGPSTVSHGFLQLANFWHTVRARHQCRLLDRQRICRRREQSRTSVTIPITGFCTAVIACLVLKCTIAYATSAVGYML